MRGYGDVLVAVAEGMIEYFANSGYNLRLTFPHPS